MSKGVITLRTTATALDALYQRLLCAEWVGFNMEYSPSSSSSSTTTTATTFLVKSVMDPLVGYGVAVSDTLHVWYVVQSSDEIKSLHAELNPMVMISTVDIIDCLDVQLSSQIPTTRYDVSSCSDDREKLTLTISLLLDKIPLRWEFHLFDLSNMGVSLHIVLPLLGTMQALMEDRDMLLKEVHRRDNEIAFLRRGHRVPSHAVTTAFEDSISFQQQGWTKRFASGEFTSVGIRANDTQYMKQLLLPHMKKAGEFIARVMPFVLQLRKEDGDDQVTSLSPSLLKGKKIARQLGDRKFVSTLMATTENPKELDEVTVADAELRRKLEFEKDLAEKRKASTTGTHSPAKRRRGGL